MVDTHALVVGASSDIGREIAASLAELGYSLSLWGRDRDRLEETRRRCAGSGRSCGTDIVDLADRSALGPAADRVAGRGRLTVVVYAAGLFDWAPADTANPDTWDSLLTVNLMAAAVLTRLTLPHLLQNAPGALLYIGSGAAHQAFATNAAYVASKHGLAGLAAATFLDVRDRDVRVSLISPGLVAAGGGLQSPAGQRRPERLLAAADVAAAVRFILSLPPRACVTQLHLQPQRTPSGA